MVYVCLQNNLKSHGQNLVKFSGNVDNGLGGGMHSQSTLVTLASQWTEKLVSLHVF